MHTQPAFIFSHLVWFSPAQRGVTIAIRLVQSNASGRRRLLLRCPRKACFAQCCTAGHWHFKKNSNTAPYWGTWLRTQNWEDTEKNPVTSGIRTHNFVVFRLVDQRYCCATASAFDSSKPGTVTSVSSVARAQLNKWKSLGSKKDKRRLKVIKLLPQVDSLFEVSWE